ncbi:RHS repeat-associated core domain-containing protein [Paraburkholderia fungorum]|nr:RHS repeat-associated core domain-containing protein [Paraburkholderia fungorum]
MYYYRNRYYSPATGRFISEDPAGWASGQTNAYAYVNGNPVQFSDPYGLHKGDQWYGYNDKNFRDWVHDEKQGMKRPGAMNFSKPMLDDMWDQWTAERCPAGKGGKSGKGGQSRD